MTMPTVAEYVADYEFRGENDYSPTDDERTMIEDAIHGFIAEQEAALTQGESRQSAPTPADGGGE